jgi:hypothetical protein
MSITRQATNKLIDMMDEGVMSARDVADMALSYMSEADVHQMMLANDIVDEETDPDYEDDEPDIDPDDLMDDFNYVGNSNHY